MLSAVNLSPLSPIYELVSGFETASWSQNVWLEHDSNFNHTFSNDDRYQNGPKNEFARERTVEIHTWQVIRETSINKDINKNTDAANKIDIPCVQNFE